MINGPEILFGILATNQNTVATADTAFFHHFSLAMADPDGFGWAVPDTGKTHPAAFFYGSNQLHSYFNIPLLTLPIPISSGFSIPDIREEVHGVGYS